MRLRLAGGAQRLKTSSAAKRFGVRRRSPRSRRFRIPEEDEAGLEGRMRSITLKCWPIFGRACIYAGRRTWRRAADEGVRPPDRGRPRPQRVQRWDRFKMSDVEGPRRGTTRFLAKSSEARFWPGCIGMPTSDRTSARNPGIAAAMPRRLDIFLMSSAETPCICPGRHLRAGDLGLAQPFKAGTAMG